MTLQTLSLAAFVAFWFAGWPMFGRYLGIPQPWYVFLISAGTSTTIGLLSILSFSTTKLPISRALAVVFTIAFFNGLSVFLYGRKIVSPDISPATFIVTVSTLMAVWAPVQSLLLEGRWPHPQQALGYGFAAITIYLLGK